MNLYPLIIILPLTTAVLACSRIVTRRRADQPIGCAVLALVTAVGFLVMVGVVIALFLSQWDTSGNNGRRVRSHTATDAASHGGVGLRAWHDARRGNRPNQVIVGFDGPDPSGGSRCVASYSPNVGVRDDGTRIISIEVIPRTTAGSCSMKRVEISVELDRLQEGDVIEAGFSKYRYRLRGERFEVIPQSTPCGRVDCSAASPDPAPCATSSYRQAVAAEIDGGIRILGEPRCDGSFFVMDVDTGSRVCAPSDGGISPCANDQTAYFVARAGQWSIVTYAESLTCSDVFAMVQIRFPAAVCK